MTPALEQMAESSIAMPTDGEIKAVDASRTDRRGFLKAFGRGAGYFGFGKGDLGSALKMQNKNSVMRAQYIGSTN